MMAVSSFNHVCKDHVCKDEIYYAAWKNGWQVISPKKSFAVFAATPTEKAEWMAHINKCIVDLLAKSRSGCFLAVIDCSPSLSLIANKKPAQEHAAVWVPDGDASTCMHCLKTKFTPINRRVRIRRSAIATNQPFSFCCSITVENVAL